MGQFTRSARVGLLMTVMSIFALALVSVGCGGSSSGSASSASPAASSTTVLGMTVTADPTIHALLPKNVVDAGEIKVASTIPAPPWQYYSDASHTELTGFEADLTQLLAAKMGIPFKWINMQWDSVILSVQGGNTDMIMGNMFDNLDREKVLNFVDYTFDGGAITVLKGNAVGLSNLDSLSGHTVSVLSGSTERPFLEQLNKTFEAAGKAPMKLLVLPTPSNLLAVQSGKADASFLSRSTAEYTAKQVNKFEVLPPDPAFPKGYEPSLVGTAVLKSNTQLTTALQKGLQALVDEGSYAKLIDKYGLIPMPKILLNGAAQQ